MEYDDKGEAQHDPGGPTRRTRADGACAAIGALVTERAWEAPTAAGGIIDQWADIAPELVGKVRPVHYESAPES
ncbi:DUF721 domain-containing protein [Streptomyces acidicola]|uniref:hypothetical protein n=1 Tax=Streptomyces acidicola TaxID=2596892 RepID=UPI001884474C|nr:hypothetical protein [Streptomyces acidicola]